MVTITVTIFHFQNMITSDELLAGWAIDSKVDPTNLRETLYSHPMLHSKYLTCLQGYRVSLRKHSLKYQKLRALKQKYYNGEMDIDELYANGWKQYLNKKPLKSEMETLLDADPDLQMIKEQMLLIESLVQTCESIIKDIGNRYFLFKTIVEYEKFQAGA